MRFDWFWTGLLLIAFALPSSAFADKSGDLAHLKQQLADKQAAQDKLADAVKAAAGTLKDTQAQMVATARAVQDNEQRLASADADIAQATGRETAERQNLLAANAAMGDLVLALTRLRRTPPELLLVRPGAPLQAAESAQLLTAILPAIRQRSATIGQTIRQLEETRKALSEEKVNAAGIRATLEARSKALDALVAQRTALYTTLNGNLTQTQADVASISKKAQSLQDLIDRLAVAQAAKAPEPAVQASPAHAAYAWSMPKPGFPQLPVAGRIITSYGEKDRIGATSQGITLAAAAGALAVAPMGGVVRYAGPFRDYGHLILLEHEDGYMSLIAGLGTVTASLGQTLQAGEPLGKLPAAPSRAGAPALYYELRYHGQPVNPVVKFPDLRVKS